MLALLSFALAQPSSDWSSDDDAYGQDSSGQPSSNSQPPNGHWNDDDDQPQVANPTPKPTAPTPKPTAEICEDRLYKGKNPKCARALSYCSTSPWMHNYCCASCKECSAAGNCVNQRMSFMCSSKQCWCIAKTGGMLGQKVGKLPSKSMKQLCRQTLQFQKKAVADFPTTLMKAQTALFQKMEWNILNYVKNIYYVTHEKRLPKWGACRQSNVPCNGLTAASCEQKAKKSCTFDAKCAAVSVITEAGFKMTAQKYFSALCLAKNIKDNAPWTLFVKRNKKQQD